MGKAWSGQKIENPCERCGGGPITHRVCSEAIDMRVCAECAEKAKDLSVRSQPGHLVVNKITEAS